MRSETFNCDNNLSSTQYSLKITLLLCSCTFCFKNRHTELETAHFLCNFAHSFLQHKNDALHAGKFDKKIRAEARAPFQNNFKIFFKSHIRLACWKKKLANNHLIETILYVTYALPVSWVFFWKKYSFKLNCIYPSKSLFLEFSTVDEDPNPLRQGHDSINVHEF